MFLKNLVTKLVFFILLLSINYESFGQDFQKWRVLFFLSPECPLCQSYSLTIKKTVDEYSRYGFEFSGVFSQDIIKDSIDSYYKTFQLSLKTIVDSSYSISRKYQASVTPQVVLLDRNGQIVYSGAIDNWVVSLGNKRRVITENYLTENLRSLVKHNKIIYKNTIAIGCIIQN
ncbi:MAG TPA: redoxin family protein [Cytophagaceae bacterium]|jgi:thioredoxin-related protein